jgi:hypothetical protein
MARSTLPAAFLAPAAATFNLRLTVRFALPSALFASALVAFALRFTLAVAVRACFRNEIRAFPASRLASEAATFAFLTNEPPTSCARSLAASTASPILVRKPLLFLRIIDSPIRKLRCVVDTAPRASPFAECPRESKIRATR